MEALQTFTQGLCKPLLIYIIFYAALILFNLTQLDGGSAFKNTIFLAFGSALIYALCSAGFEMVAWFLIALFPFFFVALLALLFLTQVLRTTVTDDGGSSSVVSGGVFASLFGMKSQEQKQLENIERELETAFSNVSSNASKCAQKVVKPVMQKLQVYKLTPVQPIMCPTCTSVSTSS